MAGRFAPRAYPRVVDRYVVIGHPVSHSLSPAIHARFAAAAGERISYGKLEVAPGEFAARAREFFSGGGRGANVTLPFKEDAFAFADVRSARAEEAGAANFLAARDARIHADNTDGAGLIADLTRNLGVALAARRILVIGAGGAVRGVLGPLLAARPAAVVLANRTLARAAALAQRFGPAVAAVPLDAIPRERFEVVINATSSATRGEALAIDPRLFAPGVFAYDMAYGAAARPFVEAASARGARASDGLGMLVEQAAESYLLWRGRRPETAPVIEALRGRAP